MGCILLGLLSFFNVYNRQKVFSSFLHFHRNFVFTGEPLCFLHRHFRRFTFFSRKYVRVSRTYVFVILTNAFFVIILFMYLSVQKRKSPGNFPGDLCKNPCFMPLQRIQQAPPPPGKRCGPSFHVPAGTLPPHPTDCGALAESPRSGRKPQKQCS